jgi:hypothetical protein
MIGGGKRRIGTLAKHETPVRKVRNSHLVVDPRGKIVTSQSDSTEARTLAGRIRLWTARSLSQCVVEICDRVRRSYKSVPMWPAGRKTRLKTAIYHEPWNNCVREYPERRREARCRLVELGLTIKLPGELKPTVDDV